MLFREPVPWVVAVRTTGNRHTEWGTMNSLSNSGSPSNAAGVFSPFFHMVGVQYIKLRRVDDNTESTFMLPEPLTSSMYDTIMACGQTDSYTNAVSSTQWTAMYSGTKTEGNIVMSDSGTSRTDVNRLLICGVNVESDDDHSVLAFTDASGQQGNGWSDMWRGNNQRGTIWSLFNDDYKNARGWGSVQGYPGYKRSNSGTCSHERACNLLHLPLAASLVAVSKGRWENVRTIIDSAAHG